MGCQWCHNPESKNFGVENFTVKDRVKKVTKNETIGYEISVDDLMKIIQKDWFLNEYKTHNFGLLLCYT